MSTTAIILAGGSSSRMDAICRETPKSMLEFAGHSFLSYLVSWLIRQGTQEVLISTCQLSEKIEEVFGANYWKKKGVKVIKEQNPLGTGGALKFTAGYSSGEEIFLCNGDTVIELNLPQLLEMRKSLKTLAAAILTMNKNVPNQGAVLVENGVITEFREGERAKAITTGHNFFRASSTGCYFLRRSMVLELFPLGRSSLEREVIPSLVAKRIIGALSSGFGFFLDYGEPRRYEILRNNAQILAKIYGMPFMAEEEGG